MLEEHLKRHGVTLDGLGTHGVAFECLRWTGNTWVDWEHLGWIGNT